MSKGKVTLPGPNPSSVFGLSNSCIEKLTEIYNNTEFIESVTSIVDKIRPRLSNEIHELPNTTKEATLHYLNDLVFDTHQVLYNLPDKLNSIVSLYLTNVGNKSLQEVIDHLWNLHAALTEAKKDKYFSESKPRIDEIDKKYAIELASQMLPLFQEHNIDTSLTASNTRVNEAIRLLQAIGETLGLMFEEDTWLRYLCEAKKPIV